MIKLNLYLYICLIRYRAINLILKKFKKYNISIILDMEDSAQDLFDKDNNESLKKISREGLKYLINNNILEGTDTFIRINSQKTKFYNLDIDTIREVLKKKNSIKGIFLPKVENYKQVIDCYDQILSSKINQVSIVPMIETKLGLENLNDILLADEKNKIIKYVHYGHYDFCLENNFWPFPEPYHFEYWDIIEKISRCIIKNNRQYIHTPFPLIETRNIYWSSINFMQNNLGIDELNLSLVNIDINYMKLTQKIVPIK